MSCNYADGLSPYSDKGKLGLPEIPDTTEDVLNKAELLSTWIQDAKHVVFHTGAGISTAAGIPDFRGPNGVWTLEKKGEKPNINMSFDSAKPTFTHMTVKALIEAGLGKFVISQNIDGLHLRSGMKRTNMSELHGNMFVAKCSYCDKFLVQGNSLLTVGQKEIGKDCPFPKPGGRSCRGKLKDTLLDWEHDLPLRELQLADMHSTLSDLSICLGTTLQIVPAGNLPLQAKKNPDGGKLVIINLQATKHDKKADLVIRAKVDLVMEELAKHLKLVVSPYSPETDPTYKLREKGNADAGFIDWSVPVSAITRLKKSVTELKTKIASSKLTQKTKRFKCDDSCEPVQLDMDKVSSSNHKMIKSEMLDPVQNSETEITNSNTEIRATDTNTSENAVKLEIDSNILSTTNSNAAGGSEQTAASP